ncbi:unnamed protein product [Discula destructiva]
MEPAGLPRETVKIKPNLTGAPETLLAILLARAIDANSSRPVLGDNHAAHIVRSLDYDFSKLRMFPFKAAVLALRARYLDHWVAAFIADARLQNVPVTVLHLAAGLDTRALRLQAPLCTANSPLHALVHWVDVDLPPVVDVRRRLGIPEPTASAMHYELHAADVTEDNWLARLKLPRGRTTFVVMEGLTMYLEPAGGHALIEMLTEYFVAQGNQMAFDCIHPCVLMMQKAEPIVRNTNSAFLWAINDLKDIEKCNHALQLKEEVSAADNPGNADLPMLLRWALWLASWIPGAKKQCRYVRFEW